MIRLAVNIDSTLAELNKFIEAASQFEDCRYYTPQFKLWQENVRSLLKRTYTEKECKDKLSVWNGVQFFSAGLEELLATVERIDPETSGLGEALALLTAWHDDLSKRRREQKMEWMKRIALALAGLAVAGSLMFLVYTYVSNRNLVNNGTMNNVNMGDHSVQQSVK